MEKRWLQNILTAGFSQQACQLGTVLSQGWFWMRTNECNLIYCGKYNDVNFEKILDVLNETKFNLKNLMQLQPNTQYTCAIRRVNCCGEMEKTVTTLTICTDASANITPSKPNGIIVTKQCQKQNTAILQWYYHPIKQNIKPKIFEIYSDNGSGTIDYQTSVASIAYINPSLYDWQSQSLQPKPYLFKIVSVCENGHQANSKIIKININVPGNYTLKILPPNIF